MHTVVAVGFTVIVALVAVWGLVSLWRVEGALTLLLRRARRLLDGLDLDQGAGAPEAHDAVLGVFDQMTVDCAPLGRAWSEYAETLVMVDGRQRATREASAGFVATDVLTAWQREDQRWLFGARARNNLPAMCVRLGLLGSLASLVVLLAMLAPAPDMEWSAAMLDVARRMWICFLPLLVALPTSIVMRSQLNRWIDALDRAVLDVAFWIDTNYRTVTPAELLARLLDGQARMFEALKSLQR